MIEKKYKYARITNQGVDHMRVNNNEEIQRSYQMSLFELRERKVNYEKMLNSGVLNETSRNKVLNLLMETEYKIRDYENVIQDLRPLNVAHYLHDGNTFVPIIKDNNILTRLYQLEEEIMDYEEKFEFYQKHNILRTEEGKNIHVRLAYLDRSQEDLIKYELNKEKRQVNRTTTLKKETKIYDLLNKLNELKREITYNEELLNDTEYPEYRLLFALKENRRKIIKISKRLKKLELKQGKIQGNVNRLIDKTKEPKKTRKLVRKVFNI